MRATYLFVIVLSFLRAAAGETAVFDRYGRLSYMVRAGDELPVHANLVAPSRGWHSTPGLSQSERTEIVHANGGSTWKGSFEGARFEQTVKEVSGKTRISLRLTAEADLDLEGVFYWIDLPFSEFVGGKAEIGAATAALPAQRGASSKFFGAEGSNVMVADAAGNWKLLAAFDQPRNVAIEDKWERSGHIYSVRIALNRGQLAKGESAAMNLTLSLEGRPDTSPALLKLDTGQRRYKFQGFGGNYCFNIESPVTDYTLKNLKVGWARTEMSLSKWAPENDQPGSRLHNEFLVAKRLKEMGIPYVISIWQLPEAFYTDPGPKPQRHDKRRIDPEKWDELLQSIGSYLLYGKERYGAEPDLFSFNESNIGIDVLQGPEEHRDAIKRLGAYFEKAGLKTKLLLGDTGSAKGTHEFALSAANDSEALHYIGAVGVHTWGGGTPEQYKAWGDLAEWLQRPLLVTELGVDAAAWRGKTYDSFQYGIREVQMYQELLLYARPQGTMQWEFTADYATVNEDLTPTPRFWFVKHFTDLTPRNSDALGTSSDNSKVLFTAFAGSGSYTLHVANLGAGRSVTIQGLPEQVTVLQAVETSENEHFQSLPEIRPVRGTATLQMPARSLITLTTQVAK